jgi:hypothetical protein
MNLLVSILYKNGKTISLELQSAAYDSLLRIKLTSGLANVLAHGIDMNNMPYLVQVGDEALAITSSPLREKVTGGT